MGYWGVRRSGGVFRSFVCRPLQDTCVSRMLSGIQLHQNLLLVLSGHVTGLSNLNSDIRDLKLRVDKVTSRHR